MTISLFLSSHTLASSTISRSANTKSTDTPGTSFSISDIDAPGVASLLAGHDGATAPWGIVDYLLESDDALHVPVMLPYDERLATFRDLDEIAELARRIRTNVS